MWVRSELKERGRKAFKKNYWKCVLVALILFLIAGSGIDESDNQKETEHINIYMQDGKDIVHSFSASELTKNAVEKTADEVISIPFWRTLMGRAIGFVLVAILLIGFLINILIFHVLEVGGSRFFLKNAEEPADLREILYGFQGVHYWNIVKICFFKNLYLFLWTLLLVIPGIIKMYEYYMIPFLLAENPNMSQKEAFAKSREMMMGNKWNTFILNLSFLLWKILSACTLGIVGIFYVNPYVYATDAELYRALK